MSLLGSPGECGEKMDAQAGDWVGLIYVYTPKTTEYVWSLITTTIILGYDGMEGQYARRRVEQGGTEGVVTSTKLGNLIEETQTWEEARRRILPTSVVR